MLKNTGETKMTAFEIAKEHFSKTDDLLLVNVHGNDYELSKSWFGGWEEGFDKIMLYRKGNRTYRLILTKNIKIKKEN